MTTPGADDSEALVHHDFGLPRGRRQLTAETWLVLGLSLGQSAVYAVLSLLNKLTTAESLGAQSTSLNNSVSSKEWLDLIYQIVAIGFALAPVALALYLLRDRWMPGWARIGLTWQPLGQNIARGLALAAAIGIPGLAFYGFGRLIGITVNVVAANLGEHWWTIPVLLASAAMNALVEEVIVVGYLVTRLRQLDWRWPAIFAASALLRGSYHLYQGFGPFIGNAVMGVVFVWAYKKWGRVMPLVIAHFILDAFSFVGYALLAPWLQATFPGVFA